MRGLQKSLLIGLLVALISTGLAAVVGSFAGYFGGWADRRSCGSSTCCWSSRAS